MIADGGRRAHDDAGSKDRGRGHGGAGCDVGPRINEPGSSTPARRIRDDGAAVYVAGADERAHAAAKLAWIRNPSTSSPASRAQSATSAE